jgi:hypothetical protein
MCSTMAIHACEAKSWKFFTTLSLSRGSDETKIAANLKVPHEIVHFLLLSFNQLSGSSGIRKFLGLPGPKSLVGGTDPDPDPDSAIIKQKQ